MQRGPGDFLGELSLLTGQAVYLTARVTVPGRIVRIDTETFRRLLAEQVDIADVLLEAFSVRRDGSRRRPAARSSWSAGRRRSRRGSCGRTSAGSRCRTPGSRPTRSAGTR